MAKTGTYQGEQKPKRQPKRDPVTGQFLPGNRSGGRPPKPEELRDACRCASLPALEVLKKILMDEKAKASDRIRCAEIIIERGFGKAVQAVEIDSASTVCGVVMLPPRDDG